MKRLFAGLALAALMLTPSVSHAQILVAGEGPVVYGHHHLNTTNMAAQKYVREGDHWRIAGAETAVDEPAH